MSNFLEVNYGSKYFVIIGSRYLTSLDQEDPILLLVYGIVQFFLFTRKLILKIFLFYQTY